MSSSLMYIFGDGRRGHELARAMCKCLEGKEMRAKCLVIVVDKSFAKDMEDVKCSQCTIVAMDLHQLKQRPDELEQVMKKHQIDWLIFEPSGDSYCSVEHVKMTMEAYKRQGGQNVVMNSIAKCDQCDEQPFRNVRQAEQMVEHYFPKSHTILRVQMPLMELDFFADGVRKERKWMLPTGESNFSPIDTKRDLACCIGHIVMERQMNQKFAGQKFTLTNSEKINGQRLAQMTGSAFKEDIKFENISIDQARKLLSRYLRGGEHGREEESSQTQKKLRRHLLNHAEHDMLLAMFKMIQQNKYDFTTDDFRKITQTEPMKVEEYLRKREDHLRGSQ